VPLPRGVPCWCVTNDFLGIGEFSKPTRATAHTGDVRPASDRLRPSSNPSPSAPNVLSEETLSTPPLSRHPLSSFSLFPPSLPVIRFSSPAAPEIPSGAVCIGLQINSVGGAFRCLGGECLAQDDHRRHAKGDDNQEFRGAIDNIGDDAKFYPRRKI
jgi:hypothetical protein